MTSSRTRLAALAVSGVAAATALTGCGLASGSSADGGSDASPVAATVQDVDVDEFAAQLRSGVESVDIAQLTVTASGGVLGATATGPIDLTGDRPELSLATDGSGASGMLGGPAELVVADGKGFVKVPLLTGKKYADLDDVLRQAGPLLGSMGGPGSAGELPDSLRGLLAQAPDLPTVVEDGAARAESVELVGTESVDGVDLEHYTLTFVMPDGPGSAGGEEKTVDTWLDEDGVPVRTESETPMGDISVELSELGEPVEIEAPSPSQVTTFDLQDLLRGLSGFSGMTEQG